VYIYHLSYIVTESDRLPMSPAFFCDKCFRIFHYDNGQRIGLFKAYHYVNHAGIEWNYFIYESILSGLTNNLLSFFHTRNQIVHKFLKYLITIMQTHVNIVSLHANKKCNILEFLNWFLEILLLPFYFRNGIEHQCIHSGILQNKFACNKISTLSSKVGLIQTSLIN
jgi:hypothetical protein